MRVRYRAVLLLDLRLFVLQGFFDGLHGCDAARAGASRAAAEELVPWTEQDASLTLHEAFQQPLRVLWRELSADYLADPLEFGQERICAAVTRSEAEVKPLTAPLRRATWAQWRRRVRKDLEKRFPEHLGLAPLGLVLDWKRSGAEARR